MARLSTHPYIVTIYFAGVTADNRPYLVMEYCSQDDLAKRLKREALSIAEVLRIGIRVTGAVETAHRAGILHRDIKPANILTTDYGNPALTDFGISATVNETAGIEGLSVPWSPPEALADPADTSVASDVYSLAATIWHLLVGRSPFALPRGPNGVNDLIHRITNTPVPRTGRPDVPAGLDRLLAAAMAKRPEDRPSSALEFARSLQAVENAAGYAETTVDILESTRPRTRRPADVDDEPGTRVRGLVVVDPDAGPTTAGVAVTTGSAPTNTSAPETRDAAPPVADRTLIRSIPSAGSPGTGADTAAEGRTTSRIGSAAPPVDDTQVRARAETAPVDTGDGAPPPTGNGRRWALAGAVVVVGGAVAAAVLASGGGTPTKGPDAAGTSTNADAQAPAVTDSVEAPTGIAGRRGAGGAIVFTWTTPHSASGDRWLVRRADPGAPQGAQSVARPTVTVTGVAAGKQACIAVTTVRADGSTSAQSPTVCGG
jgi:hypothetical protein